MKIVCFIDFSLCGLLVLFHSHLLPIDWSCMTASQSHTHQNTFIYDFFVFFCIFVFHHPKNEIRIRDKNIPVLLQTTILIWAIQAEILRTYHRQQVAKFYHFISLWTLIDVCHFVQSFFLRFFNPFEANKRVIYKNG